MAVSAKSDFRKDSRLRKLTAFEIVTEKESGNLYEICEIVFEKTAAVCTEAAFFPSGTDYDVCHFQFFRTGRRRLRRGEQLGKPFPLYVYRLRGWKLLLAAGLFCVAFAGLDEWHQSFVPGRTPSPRDVLIDSIGIFAGIEITRLLCYIGRKTIFRPLSLGNSRTKEEYEEDYC